MHRVAVAQGGASILERVAQLICNVHRIRWREWAPHGYVDGEIKGVEHMSFFKKIKSGLGIGTITFEIIVPSHVQGNSGQFAGNIVITGKGDHLVKDVEVSLERVHTWQERESKYNSTTGRHEDEWVEKSRWEKLGHFMDETQFAIAAEETKTIPFVIEFQPFEPQPASSTDGGAWDFLTDAFSPLGNTMNHRVGYLVHGDADLEDVAFDKGDQKQIVMI